NKTTKIGRNRNPISRSIAKRKTKKLPTKQLPPQQPGNIPTLFSAQVFPVRAVSKLTTENQVHNEYRP
ncbi:hypothetical protein ACDH60_27900, partial [Pseudomonas ficuserectae]|uniref:hypothetical protein n=2 Tax=Pseudomonas syringae group genomosp. 2 TaxID=251698 RepID=UPI003531C07E